MSDEQIFDLIREDLDEQPPESAGGLTEEAEIIAQSKDPVDFTELDWHIVNRPTNQGKPDNECEIGSCEKEATHHCEFLSGALFFGCENHVDEMIKLSVAKKKRKFE